MFAIHSWAGFQLTLLTFVVLLTGTLAVFGDEIDWLIDGNRRVAPSTAPPQWDAIYEAAGERQPGHRIAEIRLGEFRAMAAQVRTAKPDERPHLIFFDPATGELTGEGHWLSAQRLLREMHRYLFILTGGIGLPIVTIAAGVLAVQLVTGLVTIRKWLKGLVTLRTNKSARVVVGDFHRSMGLWTFWFTLLMVVTSFWYLAEWGLNKSGIRTEAPRYTAEIPIPEEFQTYPSPSRYIAAAVNAYPELRPTSILFPSRAGAPVTVMGRSDDWLVRDRASRVFLNPYDASVLQVQSPKNITVLQYVTELADPWHFGDVGGMLTKTIWFIAGLILTALAGTGTWLTWRRTRAGMGRWHWATVGVLGVGAVFGTLYVAHFL
ncbi:PepSY-associated TM helix domain-containing protein [Wenzhouxiangella sp. XN24]|uniref:PepSY-associated TM helix domain-containing protein n=1 Tax=Wenzhouxiangella sp. XN24 TaxID=2713569 RepID=UPI0013EC43E5|nr:PepSY-associated TM helix domain-containing protein [Wenzhouxiangella sp. XN24]NGX16291.1 PepSY domain-containing protein [Wenzhouxiangella sp. XN24]